MSLENCPSTSSSLTQSLVPQNLTNKITKVDNQYCAAGSFGDVYRCQYHGEFGVQEVAVKTFRFEFTLVEEDTSHGRSARMIRRELGIWKRLSHANVVPFLGIVYGFGRLGNTSLVSSWMTHGTLQHFLSEYDHKLTVAHRLYLLQDVANGLEYLHSLSIVHGDLTSNNVLLDDKYNARLTDFGYASLVGELPEALAYLQASTLRPGNVRWAAPECLSLNPEEASYCTIKSDVYSFGNIALQVLSGKQPWSECPRNEIVVVHLANGHKPRRPQSRPIDDQHWVFIEQCWSPVQERPSAECLVSSILDFLRAYPHTEPFRSTPLAPENSSPQSTLGGALSPTNDPQTPTLSTIAEPPSPYSLRTHRYPNNDRLPLMHELSIDSPARSEYPEVTLPHYPYSLDSWPNHSFALQPPHTSLFSRLYNSHVNEDMDDLVYSSYSLTPAPPADQYWPLLGDHQNGSLDNYIWLPENELPALVVAPSLPDVKAIAKERESQKKGKGKEFADGQHANMINGVWHCSNCGCPEGVAIGRWKGPLGDKSQCRTCGKFWRRHRRPRPVQYHLDPQYHLNLRNEEPSKTDATDAHKSSEQSVPAWMTAAIVSLQAKYPDDKFEVIHRKPNSKATPGWRIKCLDCPGKLYSPGPGGSLSNYEVHLKNRQHRLRVESRVEGISS